MPKSRTLRSLDQARREEVHAAKHYAKLRKLTGAKLFSHIRENELHHLAELNAFRRKRMRS